MRPQAIIVIGLLFAICLGLLALGPSGYEKLETLQSLDLQIEEIRGSYPAIEHLSPDTLLVWLASGKSILLVDTREAEEYQFSHLPGAAAFTSLEKLRSSHSSETPVDLIVFYDSIGKRSASLASKWSIESEIQAANLAGGIFRWANADHPLVDSTGAPAIEVKTTEKLRGHLLK